MGHTPFGYRIEDGKAVIEETSAAKLKVLYANYLSGMALVTAAKEAGIDTYHGTVSKMLANRRYLGDSFYPPIIDVKPSMRHKRNAKNVRNPSDGITSFLYRPSLKYRLSSAFIR